MPGAGVVHHIIRNKGGPPASPLTSPMPPKAEAKFRAASQLVHLVKVARA